MKIKLPELLSPAGNYAKMKAAFAYGADAVYLAGQRFGMRASADNFTSEELSSAVDYAHRLGKKLYAAVNILPHDAEYSELGEYIALLGALGVDGMICADLGVIALVRELAPGVELHVSTHASVVSARAAEQYLRLGCQRVVLARSINARGDKNASAATARRDYSSEAHHTARFRDLGSGCRCCLLGTISRPATRITGMCASPAAGITIYTR